MFFLRKYPKKVTLSHVKNAPRQAKSYAGPREFLEPIPIDYNLNVTSSHPLQRSINAIQPQRCINALRRQDITPIHPDEGRTYRL